ncbi:MAG: hypothetical protein EOM20_03795 [Spartobacteria bacterium]|nr:hypothetical protein [Spartobacteria bacterium]
MKKVMTYMLVGLLLLGAVNISVAGSGRGGFMGFIAGCCFGIRAAGDYNEGKDIHWREWCILIPCAGAVFAIWNGVDGANGMTTAELAQQYGSEYY